MRLKRERISEFKNSKKEFSRLDEVVEKISQLEDRAGNNAQNRSQTGKHRRRINGEQEADGRIEKF